MTELIRPAFSHDPSMTAAFEALPDLTGSMKPLGGLHAVVIGGGTGAPISIRTLLSMNIETAAVVAMADDGGSTGILRDQAGATTPGDIRKCITAMAGDPSSPMTQAFKTRFAFAENHTLGNLMLSALEVSAGGFPAAIKICEDILQARGHVYPSTLDRVTLVAKTRDGRTVEGQAVACHSRSALSRVMLRSEKEIVAYEPAAKAILDADLVVLGPGSLFTSIIPNLLVSGIDDALRNTHATVVFVCSLADVQGETRSMTALEHYKALCAHGAEGLIDYMIVHAAKQDDSLENKDAAEGVKPVLIDEGAIRTIEENGTKVIVRDLVDERTPSWHDPEKLRRAFLEVL